MINVLIVDDHELIRNGIKSTLKRSDKIVVIGEADNGLKALEQIRKKEVNVVLLDISIPELNGIEVAQKIINDKKDIHIIFLTMYDSYEYINKCLELGVNGYLVKSDIGDELEEAIEKVCAGVKYYSMTVHKTIMDNYTSSISQREVDKKKNEIGLTRREKEVVKLVADGFTSNEIAKYLVVSPRTVDTHRANLMKKLDVKNSAELVSKIRELEILK